MVVGVVVVVVELQEEGESQLVVGEGESQQVLGGSFLDMKESQLKKKSCKKNQYFCIFMDIFCLWQIRKFITPPLPLSLLSFICKHSVS